MRTLLSRCTGAHVLVGLFVLLSVIQSGCKTPTGTEASKITVRVTMRGPEQPANVVISLAGHGSVELAHGESHVYENLSIGSYTVKMSGYTDNCDATSLIGATTEDGDSRVVRLQSKDDEVTLQFELDCASTFGSLRVSTHTDGPDPDSDGYSVMVDGQDPRTIGITGQVVLDGLTAADYNVELSGMAANCDVNGPNPRVVPVPAGGEGSTTFEVFCSALTGTVRVIVATDGSDPDPDGYTIWLDGDLSLPAAVNDTLTFPEVPRGVHDVELRGEADNCQLLTQKTQSVDVMAGATSTVVFQLDCGSSQGEIRVRANTTGANIDSNGYVAEIDGGLRTTRIGPNDETGFGHLDAGEHQVGLTDVAANCQVLGLNPRTVNLAAGEVLFVTFGVECN